MCAINNFVKNKTMKKFIFHILLSVLFFSCGQPDKKIDYEDDLINLDEKILVNYVKSVTLIENEQRGLLSRFNSDEELNIPQKQALESLVKKNGFENLKKFEAVNRKISIVYSAIHLEKDTKKSIALKKAKQKISETEFELVQKYLQELAEVLQDINLPKAYYPE